MKGISKSDGNIFELITMRCSAVLVESLEEIRNRSFRGEVNPKTNWGIGEFPDFLSLLYSSKSRTKLEIEDVKEIDGLKLFRPKLFPDNRGYFVESYNEYELGSLGFFERFRQDNHSYSKFGVLRGLHAQPGMGKLVSVISGEIYDVAVDIRPSSKTFGKWYGIILNAETQSSFWIPDGFLHGFYASIFLLTFSFKFCFFLPHILVLSKDGAHVTYKCTAIYNVAEEFGVNPFDPEIAIDWHISDPSKVILSDRDQHHQNLKCLALKKT
uniref:dTDP-4-dehydrorhamnose 3,5-epimerase n=1 Tax=Setaria digitata TaxID=48799 RepID=A0A915PNN3_9BILA